MAKAVTKANWPYRKYILRQFRKGIGTLRVFGNRGNWQLGIETATRIVPVILATFATMKQAIEYGETKYGAKAVQIRGLAAAA